MYVEEVMIDGKMYIVSDECGAIFIRPVKRRRILILKIGVFR